MKLEKNEIDDIMGMADMVIEANREAAKYTPKKSIMTFELNFGAFKTDVPISIN